MLPMRRQRDCSIMEKKPDYKSRKTAGSHFPPDPHWWTTAGKRWSSVGGKSPTSRRDGAGPRCSTVSGFAGWFMKRRGPVKAAVDAFFFQKVFSKKVDQKPIFCNKVERTNARKNHDLFLWKQFFLAAIGLQLPSKKVRQPFGDLVFIAFMLTDFVKVFAMTDTPPGQERGAQLWFAWIDRERKK